LKRLPLFALAELLAAGEAEDVTVVVGAGEADVVVVVGAGEGEDGVVMTTGVVVCCALTVGGDSHVARSTNPAAKTARTTMDNFSKARVRSVISPPSGSLIRANYSASARFSPQTPPDRRRQWISRRHLYPLGKPTLYPMLSWNTPHGVQEIGHLADVFASIRPAYLPSSTNT
jgi:hypothetical protein